MAQDQTGAFSVPGLEHGSHGRRKEGQQINPLPYFPARKFDCFQFEFQRGETCQKYIVPLFLLFNMLSAFFSHLFCSKASTHIRSRLINPNMDRRARMQ